MRKLIFLGMLLALVAGCKRAVNVAANNPPKQQQQMQPLPNQQQQQPNQPNVHAPTGVVTNPGGGGGGGGSPFVAYKRAKRLVSENNLGQLRLFIEAMIVDEQMPTREQIAAELRSKASNLYKDWEDGVIEVTGTRRTDGIWAYTVEPQVGNDHYAVTRSGPLNRLSTDELKKQLMGN